MKLKKSGNKCYELMHVPFYGMAAKVAADSRRREEQVVGERIQAVLADAVRKDANALDAVMQSLACFDAATKRMREELRAIHE
jgi:hypothetical protein